MQHRRGLLGKKRWREGENEIGMNGKVQRGGEGRRGTDLQDEEKIGKGGKMGVRTEWGRRWKDGGKERGRTADWKR